MYHYINSLKAIGQGFLIKNLILTLNLFFFFLSISTLYAQETPEQGINIVTPSIDNYNFTKYGNLDMSNNNGGFAYSVPLYTVKQGRITVPISLNYYTDGVKVNDIAGIAGMNWNLAAGGMITRVVKDEPDEFTQTIKYRPDSQSMLDIIAGNYSDAEYLAGKRAEAMNIWNSTYNTIGTAYYNKLDTEQDAYSFNFNGHSGNFYIENDQIYLDTDEIGIRASYERLVIEGVVTLKFTFITPDGMKYIFGGTSETVESSEISGDCARAFRSPIPTTWHLKQIEYQHQTVVFSYKTIFKNYPYDFSQSVTYKTKLRYSTCGTPAASIFECNTTFRTSNAKVLTKIDFGVCKVELDYLTQREDYYAGHLLNSISVYNGFSEVEKINMSYVYANSTTNNSPTPTVSVNKKRVFLESLSFKNNSVQKFEYNNIDGLSPRLAYSQDIYGYNNGNAFASLLNVYYDGTRENGYSQYMNREFPGMVDRADRSTDQIKSLYGTLNKIIYPTKGYSVIQYENNLSLENVDVQISETREIQSNKTPCHPLNDDEFPSTQTFNFTSNGSVMYFFANASVDWCEGVTVEEGHDRHSLTIRDLTNNSIVYSLTIDADQVFRSDGSTISLQQGDGIISPINTVAGRQYSVTYSTLSKFNDVYGNLSFQYNFQDVKELRMVNYSGARVKSIADYDSSGEKYNEKKYVYNEVKDLNSGKTSLHHNFLFSPWKFDCTVPPCLDGRSSTTYVDCNNTITFGSSNYLSGVLSRGNRINYKTVSVILPNQNAIENKYMVSTGELDAPEIVYRKALKGTTRSNPEGWFDGKLEQANIYNFLDNGNNPVKTTISKYGILKEEIFYNYNTELGLDSGTGMDIMNKDHVTNDLPYNIGCNTIICNLQGKIGIEKYFNHCIIRAKTETIETEYLHGQAITNTTKYFYNAANNYLLSSQTTANSEGETLESKYYYASNPDMAGQPFRDELVAKNMLQPPLKTESYNGSKISEQLTVYDNSALTSNLLMPKSIYSGKFPDSSVLDKKITYDKYDDKGNLLQFTPEGGIPVSIIWGYHQTQPIAKLENLTYDQAESYVANIQTLSNADNDNCMSANCNEQILRTALNNLRTVFSQAMVSTYTYNPLIGVTSMTDPKGTASYYEYDSAGRLKFIKDKDLNVLQKYCYNFKGQQINCDDNSSSSVVLYKSAARSGSFTKDNCDAGGVGSAVIYTQAAGAAVSTISQDDADSKGLTKFNTDGKVYANLHGDCTFSSTAYSGSFTKNNCASGGEGSSVAYSQAAGASTSKTSQAHANEIGLQKFNTEGQVYANSEGYCTFRSIAYSGTFTKNTCALGGTGLSVTYSQAAGVETSTISQSDADAKGLVRFNADGLAYANTNGQCLFKNTVQSRSIIRTNCAAGGAPGIAIYTVPAGRYDSYTSQADADARAQNEIDVNGEAYANANASCRFLNTLQSRIIERNNCAAGGTPGSVIYNVTAGNYDSYISQADADAKAQNEINLNGQLYANTNAICTFKNTVQSGLFTRNNCAAGGTPESIYYSVSAGIYESNISQADADAKAQNYVAQNGQAYANANARCTFWNTAQSRLFTRNNCAPGGTPASVWYTVPAGRYHSNDSQAAADSQAQSEIDVNGQAFANNDANAKCTFWNSERSGLFTRNNCAPGGTPASAWYTVPAGRYSSVESQAAADAQAQNEINANGQAYANNDANAKCTFWNTAQSGLFTKNDCAVGGIPGTAWYTVPAGRYSSTESQAAADAQAQNEINANGQNHANANAVCTFSNVLKMQSFTKNNCDAGGVPGTATYVVPAGRYFSTYSQAAADDQAQQEINANGQNHANANAGCTYYSAARSGSFTRNNCGVGTVVGSTVSYSQNAGVEYSVTSQAEADARGLQRFNTDGQAYANVNGYCFYYNRAKSGSFTKNNCASGYQPGAPTIYTVPANSLISYNSQAEADNFAQDMVNSNGQTYANANGICNPIYFDASGDMQIALKKMFITLTASSSNHNGKIFNIEIYYDTASNPSAYQTATLQLLPGETNKTFTVGVPARTYASMSFY
ncbi:DUF5977 domain-containing protein [Flavobacterium fluviale]|uniref:DUF5977 domain-containing protein n=1 Tax=Flavobacterium fluviale TaxID=2249356 RepID=A0A344LS05_9FLAO|nr:DUF5977 domain-containing protein [Flavobacterium fluviale]AXB56697.1 hypothetical protein HYN86_08820 [Flavobacterium fluviale]